MLSEVRRSVVLLSVVWRGVYNVACSLATCCKVKCSVAQCCNDECSVEL